jgi:hypothetical protein
MRGARWLTLILVSGFALCGCSGRSTPPSAAPSSVSVAAQAKADAVDACRDLVAVHAAAASSLEINHVALGDDAYAAAVHIAADAAKRAADADPTWVTFYASVKQWSDTLNGPALAGAAAQQQGTQLLPALAILDSTCKGLGLPIGT